MSARWAAMLASVAEASPVPSGPQPNRIAALNSVPDFGVAEPKGLAAADTKRAKHQADVDRLAGTLRMLERQYNNFPSTAGRDALLPRLRQTEADLDQARSAAGEAELEVEGLWDAAFAAAVTRLTPLVVAKHEAVAAAEQALEDARDRLADAIAVAAEFGGRLEALVAERAPHRARIQHLVAASVAQRKAEQCPA